MSADEDAPAGVADDEEAETVPTAEYTVLRAHAAAFFPGVCSSVEVVVVAWHEAAPPVPYLRYEHALGKTLLIVGTDPASSAKLLPSLPADACQVILRLVDAQGDADIELGGDPLGQFVVARTDIVELGQALLEDTDGTAVHWNATSNKHTEDAAWDALAPSFAEADARVSVSPPRMVVLDAPEVRYEAAERYRRFLAACVACNVPVTVAHGVPTRIGTWCFEGCNEACMVASRRTEERPSLPATSTVYRRAPEVTKLKVGATLDEARTLFARTLERNNFLSVVRADVQALSVRINPTVPSYAWEASFMQNVHPWLVITRDLGSDIGTTPPAKV